MNSINQNSRKISSEQYRWLIQKLTGKTQTELIAHQPTLTPQQQKQLDVWINQIKIEHKPIQYILGSVPFCDLDIHVTPPVLIPRPETEEWVWTIINELKHSGKPDCTICDICTGSGCIALALAHALTQSTVVGCDITAHALELAQKNKEILNIPNVIFVKSDVLTHVHSQFDIIVSNPPYVAPDDWATLDPIIRLWEDKIALVPPHHEYEIIEQIINQAPTHFKPRGKCLLVLEIGHTQAKTVCTLLTQRGYTKLTIVRDTAGKDRVIRAQYTGELIND